MSLWSFVMAASGIQHLIQHLILMVWVVVHISSFCFQMEIILLWKIHFHSFIYINVILSHNGDEWGNCKQVPMSKEPSQTFRSSSRRPENFYGPLLILCYWLLLHSYPHNITLPCSFSYFSYYFSLHFIALKLWFAECVSHPNGTSIMWELVRNANFRAHARWSWIRNSRDAC